MELKPTRPLDRAVTIDTVLVRGEFRQVGFLPQEELEALEREHDAGDIRAEDTLRLIRTGNRR